MLRLPTGAGPAHEAHAMPKPKSTKRPVPDGWTFIRDATEDELKGVPPPAAGRYVVVGRPEGLGGGSVMAILLADRAGNPALITGTDWRTCFDDPKLTPWLPEEWEMMLYPTGLGLPNLEEWFRVVVENTEAKTPFGSDYLFRMGNADESFNRGESRFGVPQCPTVRGMVRHAHKIIKHLRLTGGPPEPVNPLADRASYITHLEHVRDFLRQARAGSGAESPSEPDGDGGHAARCTRSPTARTVASSPRLRSPALALPSAVFFRQVCIS
jgi:hypothetical protein